MAQNGSEVPSECPGTQSDAAGKSDACRGCPNQQLCAAGPKGPDPELELLARRLERVKRTLLVLSGKGGVGKSTVASQLAFALARDARREVGLLDIDICGPSIPKMLGLEGEDVHQSGAGWSPVYCRENLGVMSIGFMLPNPDDAVVWRGPRKNALIKQFLKDVDWGELDALVIDAPPGTSDEHISIAQYLRAVTSSVQVIMVTTPQDVALADVRKELNFCKKVGLPVLGVVENMTTLMQSLTEFRFFKGENDVTAKLLSLVAAEFGVLSDVTAALDILDARLGGAALAKAFDVPFLGAVPLDPSLSRAAETGQSILETDPTSSSAKALEGIVTRIVELM